MEKLCIAVKREPIRGSSRSYPFVITFLAGFAFALFFIGSSNNELREELIDILAREKVAAETNEKLKMEHAAITTARYMEYKAKERLGLKKAKEEEVLVLR